MNIEIHQPEVEALIQHRLTAGGFDTIEEVLLQALQDVPLPSQRPSQMASGLTGAEIITAFQRCPVKDFNFDPEPLYSPISDPVQF